MEGSAEMRGLGWAAMTSQRMNTDEVNFNGSTTGRRYRACVSPHDVEKRLLKVK